MNPPVKAMYGITGEGMTGLRADQPMHHFELLFDEPGKKLFDWKAVNILIKEHGEK